MIEGLNRRFARFAVAAAVSAAAGVTAPTGARAADLGGQCCADLEERVAELEASSVRKGNRKVSVTLSGHVNTLMLYWDDGGESNVYVGDNTEASTRFRFTGAAKFRPGWSAGFLIEIEVEAAKSSDFDQKIDGSPRENRDAQLEGRKAAWYLKSDRLGEFWLGRYSPATDDIKLLNIADTPNVDATFDTASGFLLRAPKGTGGCAGAGCLLNARIGQFAPDGDTRRGEIIRYNTPMIRGFVFSAAWGEDDLADVALRFKKEWNSIRIMGGVGYLWDTDEDDDTNAVVCPDGIGGGAVCTANRFDLERLAGSLSIMHTPSGLYAYVGGNRDSFGDFIQGVAPVTGRTSRAAGGHWYLQGGIKRRLLAPDLGATTLYGEYQRWDDWRVGLDGAALVGATPAANPLQAAEIADSRVESWGVGVVQDIDKAALQLWASYRNFDPSVALVQSVGGPELGARLEDFWHVNVGGKLKF